MSADPFVGKTIPGNGGRYSLESLLGQGGFGRVYCGQDTFHGAPVAVKLLTNKLYLEPRGIDQALNEAQAGLQIRHAYVAHTKDVVDLQACKDWPPVALVSDLYGVTLHDVIKDLNEKRRPFPGSLATRFTAHIVQATQAVHQADLVHRDIKPANLYIKLPAGQNYVGPSCLKEAEVVLGDFSVVCENGALPGWRLRRDRWKPPWHYDDATGAVVPNLRAHPNEDLYAVARVLQKMAQAGNELGLVS